MNWGFPNSVAKVKIKLSYEIGMMNYFENVFRCAPTVRLRLGWALPQ
jgi:hypothetical protein